MMRRWSICRSLISDIVRLGLGPLVKSKECSRFSLGLTQNGSHLQLRYNSAHIPEGRETRALDVGRSAG